MADFIIKLLADYLVFIIIIIAGLAMLRLPIKQVYNKIAWAIIAGLTALLTAKIASLFYASTRPFITLGQEPKAAYLSNGGFPSDHVLFVFTITLIVWVSTKSTKLCFCLIILSSLVGIGRILALVHTPLDVIGGIICAFIAILAVYGRQALSYSRNS